MYEKHMRSALELAKKGIGKVNPNPMVGAIIVKNSKVIGRGYNEGIRKKYAEINALNNAKEDVSGATMYVTLEPCSYHDKAISCIDAIIESKISKVVIGSLNPKVCGNGIKRLIEKDVEVVIGVLEEECTKLNEAFIKYILESKPFVIMKNEMSLDGKDLSFSSNLKNYISEDSRKEINELRNNVSGIMFGVNAIINNNLELINSLKKIKNPIRIIIDNDLIIPLESEAIDFNNKCRTIIVTINNKEEKIELLKSKGIEVIVTKKIGERVDLNDLIEKLGKLNIDSILLEGDGDLNFYAIKDGIVDKVQIYIAPKIMGGENRKTSVEVKGVNSVIEDFNIVNMNTKLIGKDVFIEGYINKDKKSIMRK